MREIMRDARQVAAQERQKARLRIKLTAQPDLSERREQRAG
jgi:hypothetical protein